jgi:hypothetical protein
MVWQYYLVCPILPIWYVKLLGSQSESREIPNTSSCVPPLQADFEHNDPLRCLTAVGREQADVAGRRCTSSKNTRAHTERDR